MACGSARAGVRVREGTENHRCFIPVMHDGAPMPDLPWHRPVSFAIKPVVEHEYWHECASCGLAVKYECETIQMRSRRKYWLFGEKESYQSRKHKLLCGRHGEQWARRRGLAIWI